MSNLVRRLRSLLDSHSALVGTTLLVFSLTVFVVLQMFINSINGWWIDELFSLWASDTSLPFARAFIERIAPDSNPPLYYSMLYWVRLFIASDRTAILSVNATALAMAALAVFFASRSAGVSKLAVAGIAAFALSGPILHMASEGRCYAMALAITFVASWYTALSIQSAQSRPSLWHFAIVGGLSGLIHPYAALMCGSLGAGLFVLGFMRPRRDLVKTGLALGLSSSAVIGVWFAVTHNSITNIGWIQFSPRAVLYAVWYVQMLVGDEGPAKYLLCFLVIYGLLSKATRPLFMGMGVASALFVIFPLLASLKQPMIVGRYWLIGAPTLITLMLFGTWTWLRESFDNPNRLVQFVVACTALLFLELSSVSGALAARYFYDIKLIWRGTDVVRPLLKQCPVGTVHIASGPVGPFRTFTWGFAKVAHVSPLLFTDAKLASTSMMVASSSPCPILGWAEHIDAEFIRTATDEDLAHLLKIAATTGQLEVRRHYSGFVILKRSF